MGDQIKWQLLSQHLEAMSLVNGEFEDLILLVRQLVQVLESEPTSMRIPSYFGPEEEIFSIHQEVVNQELSK